MTRSDSTTPRKALGAALLVAVVAATSLALGQVVSCASQAQDPEPSPPADPPSSAISVPLAPTAAPSADDDVCADPVEGTSQVVPTNTTQLLLVTSGSWKDFEGRLQRYERRCARAPWVPVGEPTEVMLGRHGMGWGRGLHPDDLPGPVKAEHDQRSPAGVFDLGEARGYATEPPPGTTWPFQHSGSAWRCMDNPASDAYNTFVPTGGMISPTPAGMAPREVIFDLMVFVLHNTDPVQRGAGSCVFLHVWSKQGVPTQGCVAMPRPALGDILAWLSLERRPVLAQMPQDVLDAVAQAWGLPVAVR